MRAVTGMRIVPLMSCRHLIPSWVRQELGRVVHALLPHHSLLDGRRSDKTFLAPPGNRKDNPSLSASALLKWLGKFRGLILAEGHLVIAPIANLAALLLSALTKAARLARSWAGKFRAPLARSLPPNRPTWPARPTASAFIPLRL